MSRISGDMSTGKVNLRQILYNGGIFWPALLFKVLM